MELDFCQNFIWYACRTVETKEASRKCYNFSLISDHPRDPNCVELEPFKILTQPWLYGPATDRKMKTIIYPCERFKCLIPCSCLLCDKKNPSCSSRGNCSCKECKLYMLDHENFHATFHFKCVSCEDIIRVIPNFNFFTLNKVKKGLGGVGFDHSNLKNKITESFLRMWKGKKELFFKGEDGDSDFWCYNCGILYWSKTDLTDHILKKHSVSKMFKHKYRKVPSKTTNTKCYECSRTFISVEKLHIHMESVHYGQSFKCDECGEIFTRKDSLHRHNVVTHRRKDFGSRFECEECEEAFTWKWHLIRHKLEAHKNFDGKEL